MPRPPSSPIAGALAAAVPLANTKGRRNRGAVTSTVELRKTDFERLTAAHTDPPRSSQVIDARRALANPSAEAPRRPRFISAHGAISTRVEVEIVSSCGQRRRLATVHEKWTLPARSDRSFGRL